MSPARPDAACMTCPPPLPGRHWRLADRGYSTCAACLDRMRELLGDIVTRYLLLSARPGASGGGPGRPGYGSRSPAIDHVIVMTDPRSKSCEVSRDAPAYVWDPFADFVLEPGQYGPPRGEFVEKLDVWYGQDGRPHVEQARPPRSVPAVLGSLAQMVAELRGVDPPRTTPPPAQHRWPHTRLVWRNGRPHRWTPDPPVFILGRWLDNQLDWITRQSWVADVDEDLRQLDAQLRPATGEPRGHLIGECPNTIDEGETTRQCSTPLFAPLRGDTIVCTNPDCRRPWKRPDWERLGQLLKSGVSAS